MAQERCAWCLAKTPEALTGSHGICQKHADQLYDQHKQKISTRTCQHAIVCPTVKSQQISNKQ